MLDGRIYFSIYKHLKFRIANEQYNVAQYNEGLTIR